MKTTSSSTSYRERIDYLTAILAYCWLIWISKIRNAIQWGVFYILRYFVYIFMTQKYLDKFDERSIDALETQESLFGDTEYGFDMRVTKQLIYNTFGGYMTFPIIVVGGIISSLIGWDVVFYWKGGVIIIASLLIWAVLVFIGFHILTKALDDPRVYLSYFKEFKKHDEKWLRKWKRYTILLYAGGLLSATLGIVLFIFVF